MRAWRAAGSPAEKLSGDEALTSVELALEAGLYPTAAAGLVATELSTPDHQAWASVSRLRLALERWDLAPDVDQLGRESAAALQHDAELPPLLAADAHLGVGQASFFLLDLDGADAHFEAASARLGSMSEDAPRVIRLEIERARLAATRGPSGSAALQAAMGATPSSAVAELALSGPA